MSKRLSSSASIPAPRLHDARQSNNTQPNAVPTDIYSQKQRRTNKDRNTENPTTSIPIAVTQNDNREDEEDNDDPFVLLHHEDKAHYAFQQYCLPVKSSFTDSKYECKYGRNCIVSRTHIIDKGTLEKSLSPTVLFRPESSKKSKFVYNLMDTRLLRCFKPNCTKFQSLEYTLMHYACYVHSFTTKANRSISHIEVNCNTPILRDYLDEIIIRKNDDDETIDYPKDGAKVILPVCGKRCHTAVIKLLEAKKKKKHESTNTDGTTKINWDNDGDGIKRSSIRVLVEWLTTEENATQYYGGKGKRKQTSADRKDTYHLKIQQLIKEENGSNRSLVSIQSRIVRLMQSYHKAKERFVTTGNGLNDAEFPSFHSMILNKVCRWYNELDPVLRDRPNVFATYTNEDEDEEDVSSCGTSSNESMVSVSDSQSSEDEVECIGVLTEIQGDTSTSQKRSSSSNSKGKMHRDESNKTDNSKSSELNTSAISTLTSDFDTVTNKNTSKELKKHCMDVAKQMKQRIEPKKKKKKVTPFEAKNIQNSLLRKHKKQIHGKTRKPGISVFDDDDQNERDILLECKKSRLKLDEQMHSDMNKREEKKMEMEEKRLRLDTDLLVLKNKHLEVQMKKDEIQMKRDEVQMKRDEIMQAQEKKNLILLNLQVFKERQAMKERDPTLTDEYLNKYFPLDIL